MVFVHIQTCKIRRESRSCLAWSVSSLIQEIFTEHSTQWLVMWIIFSGLKSFSRCFNVRQMSIRQSEIHCVIEIPWENVRAVYSGGSGYGKASFNTLWLMLPWNQIQTPAWLLSPLLLNSYICWITALISCYVSVPMHFSSWASYHLWYRMVTKSLCMRFNNSWDLKIATRNHFNY